MTLNYSGCYKNKLVLAPDQRSDRAYIWKLHDESVHVVCIGAL